MGVPVTVAMRNAYYVFFCAHGNSHAHAHAYSHEHAHDYVHGHVYYWQTCSRDSLVKVKVRDFLRQNTVVARKYDSNYQTGSDIKCVVLLITNIPLR